MKGPLVQKSVVENGRKLWAVPEFELGCCTGCVFNYVEHGCAAHKFECDGHVLIERTYEAYNEYLVQRTKHKMSIEETDNDD